MTNGLYLRAEELERFIESVEGGIGRDAYVPIVEIVESVGGVG